MISSSYISFGILPQNTSQPLPGGADSQFGGGPPYFRWPEIHHKALILIDYEYV